ncbi:hypothetical protein ABIA41_007730 [Bradyrhizobium sp. USDA 313]
MKLTSIMRAKRAASDLAKRRRFGAARVGNQDVDRLARTRSGNGGFQRRFVRDISDSRKVRGTCIDRLFENRRIPAKHGYRRTSADERSSYRTADAAAAAGHQRVRRVRQSGHALTPSDLVIVHPIYFNLQIFATKAALARANDAVREAARKLL